MATADDGLTYKQRESILRDAILGVPMQDADPAAQAWRRQCDEDVRKSLAAGIMPEIPFDPTYDDD